MSPKRESPIKAEEPPVNAKEEDREEDTVDVKQDILPAGEASTSKPERTSKSPPSHSIAPPPNTLPPLLLALLQTIQSTLSTSFSTSPPHTAQRLAELILHPTKHYRTLPSYLRALDRIVSVASPASIFPLPDLTANPNHNVRMANGTLSPSPDPIDRDDNFIGGAELTEIPWLRNQSVGSPLAAAALANGTASDLRTESKSLIDGPNGAGSVETVTVTLNSSSSQNSRSEDGSGPGITQGELLRQEQEAGIVPVPTSPHNGRITRSSAASAAAAATRAVGLDSEEGASLDEDPEPVHARGPGVIGMEDMGPQAPSSGLAGGLDLEGALGRRGEGETMASTVGRPVEGDDKEGDDKDGDGDVVVADADGIPEGEERMDASGENKGADAVDSTAL